MSDIVNIRPYCADLSKPLDKTELHTLFVMGDNQAHRFELTITNGSQAADLTGSTVLGFFTNFKENTTVEVEGSVEGWKAVVTLSKPCYSLHGQFVLSIQIKTGGVENTVFLGEGYMRRSKGDTIIYDDYIIMDVDALLAQIQATKDAASAANAAAASANEQSAAAETAARNADAQAEAANTAAQNANAAAGKLEGLTVSATDGDAADAQITEEEGGYHIGFTLPRGAQGAQGETGNDGITPHIGDNGNWFVGDTDTGVQAQGPAGANGTGSGTVTAVTVNGETYEPDQTGNVDLGVIESGGSGVPDGGTAGQTLVKQSDADGDALWQTLTAEDVGARSADWMPTAQDVGALSTTGTAADSGKLDGKTWAERMLEIYPVGAVYISTADTSPASLFGGTWEQLQDRFLLAAGGSYTAGSEGGEAENLLTAAQLPAHTHTGITHGGLRLALSNGTAGSDYEFYKLVFERTSGYQGTTPSIGANSSAAGETVNNMPPYLAVNMWKRVA